MHIVHSPKQTTFRVRNADSIQFNHEVIRDIMYLEGDSGKKMPVPHIRDAVIRFNAAALLPRVDFHTIWNTLL